MKENHFKDKKPKINKRVNSELNVLDSIINKNLENTKLSNDVHRKNGLKDISKINKKSEPTPVTLINVFGGKKSRNKNHEGLRVLIDTGCSHSIILKKYCKKLKDNKEKEYATGSGTLKTKHESKVYFSLPEFSDQKIINWVFNVTNSEDLGYDVILGRDILLNLNMNISFENRNVSWEGIEIPMRDYNKIRNYKFNKMEFKAFIQERDEPVVTQEATDRILKILDSNYHKANLKSVVQNAKHLNNKERDLLYKLLTKYEDIFDGTLGEWKTTPVDFEMVEGAVPHSQRHYPVPHLYKQTFKKELDRLEGLGVLEKVQQSEWGSPTFIIPKKTIKFGLYPTLGGLTPS
jgi:hypothetical protein